MLNFNIRSPLENCKETSIDQPNSSQKQFNLNNLASNLRLHNHTSPRCFIYSLFNSARIKWLCLPKAFLFFLLPINLLWTQIQKPKLFQNSMPSMTQKGLFFSFTFNPPCTDATSEPTHLYRGRALLSSQVYEGWKYILGLYTSFGALTSKFGKMAAILIFGHFWQGKKLRFLVGPTKMAIKSSKLLQISQVMAQIKAKRYSYENMAVWSAKNASF